jgi:hypothetical protein
MTSWILQTWVRDLSATHVLRRIWVYLRLCYHCFSKCICSFILAAVLFSSFSPLITALSSATQVALWALTNGSTCPDHTLEVEHLYYTNFRHSQSCLHILGIFSHPNHTGLGIGRKLGSNVRFLFSSQTFFVVVDDTFRSSL